MMADGAWERIKEAGKGLAAMLRNSLRRRRARAAREERRKNQTSRARQRDQDRKHKSGRYLGVAPAMDLRYGRPIALGRQQPPEPAPPPPAEIDADRVADNANVDEAAEPVRGVVQKPPPDYRTVQERLRDTRHEREAGRQAVRHAPKEPVERFDFTGQTTTADKPQSPVQNDIYNIAEDRERRRGKPTHIIQTNPPVAVYADGREEVLTPPQAGIELLPNFRQPIDVTKPGGKGDVAEKANTDAIVAALRPVIEQEANRIIDRLIEIIKENAGYGP